MLNTPEISEATVWDPATGDERVADTGCLTAGYADERTLVRFFDDLTAGLFDLVTERRVPPQLDLDITGVTAAQISPQAGLVAIGHEDGSVTFYDRSGTEPFPPLQTPGAAYVESISDDGGLIVVTTLSDVGTVYDTHTGRSVAGPAPGLRTAKFGPDESSIFAATTDGHLVELAVPTLRPIGDPFPTLAAPGFNVNVSDDGRTVEVVDTSNNVTLYDTATRASLGDPFVLGEPAELLNAELAPSGRFTVLGTSDGVETWNLVPDHWRDAACTSKPRTWAKA